MFTQQMTKYNIRQSDEIKKKQKTENCGFMVQQEISYKLLLQTIFRLSYNRVEFIGSKNWFMLPSFRYRSGLLQASGLDKCNKKSRALCTISRYPLLSILK